MADLLSLAARRAALVEHAEHCEREAFAQAADEDAAHDLLAEAFQARRRALEIEREAA